MTLPINIVLPVLNQEVSSINPQDLYVYLRKLAYVITTQLQQTNQTLNGVDILYTDLVPPFYGQFIIGSTLAGTATYTNTTMTIRQINLLTFVSFDITWSGSTGTGNLLVQVPYFANNVSNMPFAGVIESDGMTYSAGYTYLTCNIPPNTNTINVNQNGSGSALIALPITASGHIRGSIVYAAQ